MLVRVVEKGSSMYVIRTHISLVSLLKILLGISLNCEVKYTTYPLSRTRSVFLASFRTTPTLLRELSYKGLLIRNLPNQILYLGNLKPSHGDDIEP